MREVESLDIDEGYLLETLVPNDLRYVRKIRYLLLKAHENLDNEDLKKYSLKIIPEFDIAAKYFYDLCVQFNIDPKQTLDDCPKDKIGTAFFAATHTPGLQTNNCMLKGSGLLYDMFKCIEAIETLPVNTITHRIESESDETVCLCVEHIIEGLSLTADHRLKQLYYYYSNLFGVEKTFSFLPRHVSPLSHDTSHERFIRGLEKFLISLRYYTDYIQNIYEQYAQ